MKRFRKANVNQLDVETETTLLLQKEDLTSIHYYTVREWVDDLNSVFLPSNGGRSSKLLNTICNQQGDVKNDDALSIFKKNYIFPKRKKKGSVCV